MRAFPVCQSQEDNQSAQCTGQARSDLASNADPFLNAALIGGYHPADLLDAYDLTYRSQTAVAGATVAVVIAYHTPYLAWDLAVYRHAFGLSDCTLLNGCLSIVEMSPSVRANASSAWRVEGALDTQMVSAVCPACRILVVEAKSANIGDLAAAVDFAAQHATVVNNSFAIPESPGAVAYESHWNHPGVPIVAGAGDGGYAWGISFPASSRYVTAVGGTRLERGTGGSWVSSVWALSGSGCSRYIAKPAWQHDAGCPRRMLNDVSAVADPQTGVAAYVTENGGWNVYGGTSVATPIISASFVIGRNSPAIPGAGALYASPKYLHPVVFGNNGTCAPAYFCTGGPGYNGPAGLGTPLGL